MVASALAWLVGAAVAVTVGLLALSLIGDGLTARTVQPLGNGTTVAVPTDPPPPVPRPEGPASPPVPLVAVPPRTTPPPAPPPPTQPPNRGSDWPPATPTPRGNRVTGPGAAADRLISSDGGSALAHCGDGGVYLVSWIPGQSFRVGEVHRGPGAEAKVTFTNRGRRVGIAVRCLDGVPQARVRILR
jgi:serine/threonine-protein kinase